MKIPSGSLFILICFFITQVPAEEEFLSYKYVASIGKPGTGPLEFSNPQGITVDRKGNIYVVDRGNNRIQKISLAGGYITEFGGYGSGPNRLNEPGACRMGRGFNIYVCDTQNQRVLQLDKGLRFRSEFTLSDRFKEFTSFYVRDLAVASNGDIYLCEPEHGKIVQFSRFDKIKRVFDNFSQGMGIIAPECIAICNFNVFVGDNNSGTILKYDFFGNYMGSMGKGIKFSPNGLITMPSNRLLAADKSRLRLDLFDFTGKRLESLELKSIIPVIEDCSGIAAHRTRLSIVDSALNKVHILSTKKQ
jgi:sugar lactone lactonase YvrE